MRILFDHSTPAPLGRWLRDHEVVFAASLGWHKLKNGALLTAAETAGFDVMITCDQSIPYQQNLTDRKIALIILSTNTWCVLRPVANRIANLVKFVQRGQVTRINVADF